MNHRDVHPSTNVPNDDGHSRVITSQMTGHVTMRLIPTDGYGKVPVTELIAFDRADWHDDDGPVLWWSWPIQEPPWAGTPYDEDFPEYMTHWTRLVCPTGIMGPK